MGKTCWLMHGCPARSGVCYSCEPDGDDCPIWRWFKKQIVVRCEDCKHSHRTHDGNVRFCELIKDENNMMVELNRPGDWYCADGERSE